MSQLLPITVRCVEHHRLPDTPGFGRRALQTGPATPSIAGFTLIELMVTLVVAIMLTMLVVPTVHGLVERQRLSVAVEAVQAQMTLAKSEAAKRSQEVSVSASPGSSWDVTMTYLDQVTTQTVDRRIDGENYSGIVLSASVAGNVFNFDPVRGTVTPGSMTLSSTNHEVDIRLDVVGRMSICSPNYGRYPACL